jgi:hypothetical protein
VGDTSRSKRMIFMRTGGRQRSNSTGSYGCTGRCVDGERRKRGDNVIR